MTKEGSPEALAILKEFDDYYNFVTKTLKMKFDGKWAMVHEYNVAFLDAHDSSFAPYKDDIIYASIKQKKKKLLEAELATIKADFVKSMVAAKADGLAELEAALASRVREVKHNPQPQDDDLEKKPHKEVKDQKLYCKLCKKNVLASLKHPKRCEQLCPHCSGSKLDCSCEEMIAVRAAAQDSPTFAEALASAVATKKGSVSFSKSSN